MAPPRPSTPLSEDGEAKPPRAFVRQCVFYEKYGGCKFGKDCFYAHNDEMTLGVRNAMQMAQAMGRGGIGGGVEIRYDERENEVKMVRIAESDKHRGKDEDALSNENSGYGKYDGYGRSGCYASGRFNRGRPFGGGIGGRGGGFIGGRGRFGRNGRIFRGLMRGGRGARRFISPVRSSGNIFAEEGECCKRKSKKDNRSSRSSTPNNKRSRRLSTFSKSSNEDGRNKNSSRSTSRNSRSKSKSHSRSSSWNSNSPKHSRHKKSYRKRSSDSPPDTTRMELRSLAKNLAKEKYLKAKNEERQQLHNRHYHHKTNNYYQHKHHNIQHIKHDRYKKERKSSRKSPSKSRRHHRSSSSSTYSSAHSHKSYKNESTPKISSPKNLMSEENQVTEILKEEKNIKIKEATDNTKEEICSLIDENIELVYEDYNNTKDDDEERQRLELIDKKKHDEDALSVTSHKELKQPSDLMVLQNLKASESCSRRPSSR